MAAAPGGAPALSRGELHAALATRNGAANQEVFDRACVGVAGLGGLGSNVAVHLARMGVGRIVLVDFDEVEPTNLNRQHYALEHLGRPKAQALAEQLRAVNPYLALEPHVERVGAANVEGLFGACDVVCECFDRPDQKAMLLEAMAARLPGTPLVMGNGMAGAGSGNDVACARRLGRVYVCGDGASDAGAGLPLLAPRVALVAAHEALMAARLLLGECEP